MTVFPFFSDYWSHENAAVLDKGLIAKFIYLSGWFEVRALLPFFRNSMYRYVENSLERGFAKKVASLRLNNQQMFFSCSPRAEQN